MFKRSTFVAIRGILFDFDGTIANTTPLILATFHNTLEHYLGKDYGISDQEIINTFGLPLREGLARFIGADHIEEKVAYYREYNNTWHDVMIRSFPEVADGCARIQAAGIPQIIVTSKLHDSCLRGLRCIGQDKYMDAIVSNVPTISLTRSLWKKELRSWGLLLMNACA